jgi:hypothetical protein
VEDKRWMAPLLGIAFIVLAIIGFAVGGEPPDVDEGAQETLDFYLDEEDSVFFGSVLEGLGAVMFIFFGGVVRSRLREVEGPRGTLSAIAFAGTIVLAMGLAIDATINIAIADAAEDIDPVTAHTLAALWQNDWVPLVVGMLTFLIATGLSIIRYGVLPKWLGWAAIVLAILAPTPAGAVGFIGAAVFVIVLSVMLAMRDRNAASGSPAPPPPPPAPTTPG